MTFLNKKNLGNNVKMVTVRRNTLKRNVWPTTQYVYLKRKPNGRSELPYILKNIFHIAKRMRMRNQNITPCGILIPVTEKIVLGSIKRVKSAKLPSTSGIVAKINWDLYHLDCWFDKCLCTWQRKRKERPL